MLRPHSLVSAVLALTVALGVGAAPVGSAAPASSGLNDWSCRPSPAHPRPVVLLHGLNTTAEQNWALHGPAVAEAGYCVFSLTYSANSWGMGGNASVEASARQIGRFIDRVLKATRSERVDLVGHSLGGFLSLYVTKVSGYAPKVARVVAMAPPTHGTTLFGATNLARAVGLSGPIESGLAALCVACVDLVQGGPAVVRLGRGPIARPGVRYTIIASRNDVVVTPSSRSFIREPRVRNYYIQDRCPIDPVGHFGIGIDSGVTSMILNGLDRESPVRCGVGPPV